MYGIICEHPHQLASIEITEPTLQPGHVLLQVKRVGICGTDLHAFKGQQAYFTYPRILGHELAAEVIESESEAAELKVGDRVTIMPYIHCGQCDACRAGQTNCCESLKVFGVHVDGGMRERITFPAHLLLKANTLSWNELAVVEPLSIGAHALRRAHVQKGNLVVIMGAGPIGVGLLILAKSMGATVVVVDVNEHRLKAAHELFSADHVVNPLLSDGATQLRNFTGGHLADVVIDATGNTAAIEGGIQYMRHGGSLVLVGLTRENLKFLHPAIHAKETTILCSRNATREDFEMVVGKIATRAISVERYVTSVVPHSSIPEGFATWCAPDSKEIKVLTTW